MRRDVMATMECGERSSMREVLLAACAYMLVLAGEEVLLPHVSGAPWRVLVALLPAIPLGFNVWVWVRNYRSLDELQQRIQLIALAVAFAGTVVLTSIYGLLQDELGLPIIDWTWVATFMVILWGVATVMATRRYA
jgi:hypothetical protein